MNYTLSDSYVTDSGTGNRMHQSDQPVPTMVSPQDMNMVLWSLMEVVKQAGLSGAEFDKDDPDSYRVLLTALNTNFAARAGDSSVRFRSRTFTAGDESLSGAALRDAYVVGRSVVGATDCHGFADRTVISGVTDVGTYGAFDVTVQLQGGHNQNHMYSFQDRARYAGSAGGVLQNSAGFISQAIHSGAGTIDNRVGLMVDPMSVTGGGTITSQIGLLVNHLGSATNNVGVYLGQTSASGWAVYAPGGGKSFHAGQFGFGVEPLGGVPVTFKDTSDPSNATGFLGSDLTRVTLGASGNTPVALVTNGQARVVVDGSASSYALRPNGDNTQPLGGSSYRWSVVYAGTGTINTSDLREKSDVQSITPAVLRAWGRVRWCAFRMLDSVETKGDGARWHFGAVAQEVEAAFKAEGLDPFAYGVLCLDRWDDQYEPVAPVFHDCIVDETGAPLMLREGTTRLVRKAGERYGLRYDEAQAIEAAYVRQELQRLEQRFEGRSAA